MKRHEDPFFEMFREGLHNYEAQPSAEVYAGVQSQLRKGAFLRFSWYQFNVYYLLGIVGVAIAAALVAAPNEGMGNSMASNFEPVTVANQLDTWSEPVASIEQLETEQVQAVTKERTRVATAAFASQTKASAKTKVTAQQIEPNALVAATPEVNEEAPKVTAAPCENHEAPEMPAMETKEAPQLSLPTNWAQAMQSPELNTLIDQLNSDSEVVYLTLPVKIEVEEEE